MKINYDITVEDKKYTDGSVAFTTIKQGTYGMKGELHNVNEAVCKKVLKMTEIAAVTGSTGKFEEKKMLAYGANSGSIPEAVVYLEFDKSNAYKGMLIPKSSIASIIPSVLIEEIVKLFAISLIA